MKFLFILLAILISFPLSSLKSEEPQNCPSTCQSLYWLKVYNELAEKLRYLSLLAGKDGYLIPCSGYFGYGETKIKNFKSEIYFGGNSENGFEWTYNPMKKGKNNGFYYKKESFPSPIWQDRAGGKTGIYDAGIDVIVYDGQDCNHPLENGDKGFSDSSIYYFDNNENGIWDTDEEVWRDSLCNPGISGLAEILSDAIYDLCEKYYVDPNFQGNLTGNEEFDIPYMLKKDANGNYAQNSRIKLFPDRTGEDAYRFTLIPSYLPDGTKIANTPVYGDIHNAKYIFPVFFDEVRQILNSNIMKAAWIKYSKWTSNGENNENCGGCEQSDSVTKAYNVAANNYNASPGYNREGYGFPSAYVYYYYTDIYYDNAYHTLYSCTIYRNYSYLGLPKSFTYFQTPKFNADFYIYSFAYSEPYTTHAFNNNGDTVIENKWCRFAQEFQCIDVNVKKKFGSLILPQINNLSRNKYTEGYSSFGAILINYDLSPFNIPPFADSYPVASDTNRDDIYDTGINLHDMNNETGTIVHSPDMDEPQVILPLRWNTAYTDLLQYPEYISIGGMNQKEFDSWEKLYATSRFDDRGMLLRSSKTHLFPDLFIDDADKNIHIKRIGVVRPRGQIVLFDFPWDTVRNKFSDIGIPLGIHSKRTYRLVSKDEYNGDQVYRHLFLQFDSGICHDYGYWYDYWYNNPYYPLFCGLEFSSKYSGSTWNDIETIDQNTHSYYPIRGYIYDIEYERNNEGLLSKLIYKTKDGKNTVEVSMEYDSDSKITKLTKKVPKSLAIDGRTEYEISVDGNTITYPDGTSSAKTQTDIVGKARTVVISNNIPGAGTVETTYKYTANDLITSIKVIANGSSNETIYTYYSGEEKFPNTSKKYQKIKSIVYPDNSWKYCEYNGNGWISKIYSPFGNETLPAENPVTTKSRQEEYSYGVHGYDYDESRTEVIADPGNIWEFPRTTINYAKGLETGRSYYLIDTYRCAPWIGADGLSFQKTCSTKNALWNDQSNLTKSEWFSSQFDYIYGGVDIYTSESPTQVINIQPDTKSYGELINPNILPEPFNNASFKDRRTDIRKILDIYAKDNKTLLSSIETVTNPRGITWSRKVTDGPSSKVIDSSISTTDSFGRITSTTHIDGTTETFGDYCLYGPTKYIDGNGNITTYTYNTLGRITIEVTPTATITRSYDAIGNVTGITTAPKGKGETKFEVWTYDSMSRITSHTDSVGRTTYTYTGTKTEINYPDGTDQTIQKNLDGSIASIYGTAVTPVTYDYGVDPVKGKWVKEIRGSAWTITYYNMLGQPHRTENSAGYWAQNTYDNTGRENGSYDSEGHASSTVYNSKNEITQQTVNGVTTDFAYAVTQKNGKTVLQKTSTVHNSTGDIVSINESAVTGWEQWNSVNGRETHVVTTPHGAGNYTVETKDFEGNITTEEISRTKKSKNIQGLATITSEYDGLGRTIGTKDSRKPNGNTFTYRPKTDQIASVSSSDGSRTSYQYADKKYAPTKLTPAGESKALGLKYTDMGSLEKIIGLSVFDASNIYDDMNRQTGLLTKGIAGDANTTLVYDEGNSRLKEKWIAGQKCYEFEYEPDGRVKTFKKNINGTNAVKLMQYTSAPNLFNAGYTWSDGTPSVLISEHSDLGQPGIITTGGVCSETFTYNPDTQIKEVKFASNLTGNNNISYGYQNLRRSQMTSGSDVVSYTYESGRLKTISSGNIEVTYDYVPQSLNLVNKKTIRKGGNVALVSDILWQDNADRISSVANTVRANTVNSFAYDYNPKGEISKITRETGMGWRYEYDGRGQLENAAWCIGNVRLLGNEFVYLSDSIGNILHGGKKKKDGSNSVQFTPDVFNRINTRIVGDKIEVSGSVKPDSSVPENTTVTVSVNNVKAAMKDNGFTATVDANNTDFAVSKSLNIVGVFFAPEENPEVGGGRLGNAPGTDVVATVTGNVLIPKASENPVYDLGGRLVSTSLWNYSWDSEDRLIGVSSNTGIPACSLEFAYDHAGRRIKKTVKNNNVIVREHHYYYDTVLLNGQPSDFGLLTNETIISNEPNETTNLQYLWGLDLNGSYQGLGGNGGLIAVIDKTHTKVYLPCSDAKGTIHSYIDTDTGSTVAKFAYDPYGKITSSSISDAYSQLPNAFPFTFQSKYYDSELQCYYFGFRYYDPATCRWLNRDPIGESGGLNLYAYCNNDPVNGMDYLGCVWYNPLDSDFLAWEAGKWTSEQIGAGAEYTLNLSVSAENEIRPYTPWGAGIGIYQGTRDWNSGHISGVYLIEFVGGQWTSKQVSDISDPAVIDVQRVFVNGMLNNLKNATRLAGAHTNIESGIDPSILIHNPTNGFWADLAESTLEKFIAPSSVSKDVAAELSKRKGQKLLVVFHSQGGLIGTSAMQIMAKNGIHDWGDLQAEHHGSAAYPFIAEQAVKSVGGEWLTPQVHPLDTVGAVVGANNRQWYSPVTTPASILGAFLLFTPYSSHTYYSLGTP